MSNANPIACDDHGSLCAQCSGEYELFTHCPNCGSDYCESCFDEHDCCVMRLGEHPDEYDDRCNPFTGAES